MFEYTFKNANGETETVKGAQVAGYATHYVIAEQGTGRKVAVYFSRILSSRYVAK